MYDDDFNNTSFSLQVDELLAALAGRAGISSTQHTEISSMQVKVESLTSQVSSYPENVLTSSNILATCTHDITGP